MILKMIVQRKHFSSTSYLKKLKPILENNFIYRFNNKEELVKNTDEIKDAKQLTRA